jgi:hypothetical protein
MGMDCRQLGTLSSTDTQGVRLAAKTNGLSTNLGMWPICLRIGIIGAVRSQPGSGLDLN